MTFDVIFSSEAERDFELILEFLVESYIEFGEDPASAIEHAEQRLHAIQAEIETLATAPHRGTLRNDILPGLRHLTLGRAIVWFDIVDSDQSVRVLAIFFGGQDHVRHMLARLLQ